MNFLLKADKEVIVEINPWRSIWFRPRKAIRQILDEDYSYWVIRLAALTGLGHALIQATRLQALDGSASLFWAFVLGPILGLIGLYLFGWLYGMVGGWLGGQAPTEHVRTAIAWSQLPFFIPFFLSLPALFLLQSQGLQIIFSMIVFFGSLISGLWSLFIGCQAIGEAHRFSGWRGFFTMFLGNMILGLFGFLAFMVIAVVLFIAAFFSAGKQSENTDASKQAMFSMLPQSEDVIAPLSEEMPQDVEEKELPPVLLDIDFESFKSTQKKVKVGLQDGKSHSGMIIANGEADIFLDSPDGVQNILKSEIQSVEAGEKEETK